MNEAQYILNVDSCFLIYIKLDNFENVPIN